MSAAPALAPRLVRVALVGSPNTGKTTLFNALTGSSARVGNYPGVTVERREGKLLGSEVRILDLPGTYALHGETPDEQIVTRVLGGRLAGETVPDALVVVADATTLRRGLGPGSST
jgi:ferrous iron transport protein B